MVSIDLVCYSRRLSIKVWVLLGLAYYLIVGRLAIVKNELLPMNKMPVTDNNFELILRS